MKDEAKMEHRFDADIAAKYGLCEAILYNHIAFWVEKNRSDKKCYFEGEYWTFSSVKQYKESFPYLTEWQIRSALEHLRREGVLKTGNFSKSRNRTLWYTIAADRKCNCGVPQMDLMNSANAFEADRKSTLYQDKRIKDNKHEDSTRACARESEFSNEKKTDGEKRKYAEKVFLTEAEYASLCEKYGAELTDKLISLLSEKKVETGKYGTRDFRSLSTWVYDAYREREEKEPKRFGSLPSFDLADFAEKPPEGWDRDEKEKG